MKRLFQWMLAAILFCGVAAMFTSCSNEDNPVDPVDNLSEKIIGKWMYSETNGEPVPTNKKSVYTFVSPTKAFVSVSNTAHQEVGKFWSDQIEADVAISGNVATLTMHTTEFQTGVVEYTVSDINGRELNANRKATVYKDGQVVLSEEQIILYEKITADYRETVLGLWECTGLTGGETFNDANARLEFLDDGTYRYYRQDDAGQWQAVTTREFQDYFVDGTLLATRWKNQGEDELREWWEIESLSGDEMVWTALRQNADGSTFQQKMTWKKIDLKLEEKIIGKWMVAERDGQAALTNEKMLFSFVSTTKGYQSTSIQSPQTETEIWVQQQEMDVVINGNEMTITCHPGENTTSVTEFDFISINDSEFTAKQKLTVTGNGNVRHSSERLVRFVKITADYRQAILGTWQGHCTSEGSVFDDGQEHRWQYNADGTYVYYVKDGNNWVPYATNTLNEYFVDGNLLCTRWIDNGVENREWWEITINGNKMNWTALRENPDRTTFTATFEMKKVE